MKTNLNFRKFTSLLLTIIMLLSMGSFSALAEDAAETTPEMVTIEVNAQNVVAKLKGTGYDADSFTTDGDTGILIPGKTWVRYKVEAPEGGLYNVTLNYKTSGSEWYCLINESMPVEAKIRGVLSSSGGVYIDATTWTGSDNTPAITMNLYKGTNYIKVLKENNNGYLSKITFTKEKKTYSIYQHARDYYDGGIYNTTTGEETASDAIISGGNVKIGKKTVDEVAYGSYVKYKINAPETGLYKVSFYMANYGSEWIHGLTNETMGITKKGVVPNATTSLTYVDTWKPDNTGDYVAMTIPMVEGENIISLKKSNSDLWFNAIYFERTGDYTATTYTAQQIHDNATEMSYEEFGYKYETCFQMRGTLGNYITLKHNGPDGKFNIGVYGRTEASGVKFSLTNERTGKSVIGTSNTNGLSNTPVWAVAEGLDLRNGDSFTLKYISGTTWMSGLSITEVGDYTVYNDAVYVEENATDKSYDRYTNDYAGAYAHLLRSTNATTVSYNFNDEAAKYLVTFKLSNGEGTVKPVITNNRTGKSVTVTAETSGAYSTPQYVTTTTALDIRKGDSLTIKSASGTFFLFETSYTEVGNYDAYTSVEYLNDNATSVVHDGYGNVIWPYNTKSMTIRSAKSNYITYDFNDASAKYIVSAQLTNGESDVSFEIVNNTTGKTVSATAPLKFGFHIDNTTKASEALEIGKGDSITFRVTSGVVYFNGLIFTEVGEYTPAVTPEEPEEPTPEDPAKIVISANAQDYIPGGVGVSYSAAVENDGTNGIKISENNWVRYSVYAPEAGLYNVTLNYKTGGSETFTLTNETLPIAKNVSGILVSSNNAYSDATNWTGSTNTPAIQIYLNEGTNFIKITKNYNPGNLSKITFTKNKEGVVVYKNALDYYDGGLYDADGLEYTTAEAKALIVSGSNVKIGKKTLNDTTYGSFVKYKVDAPETGVYKISMRMGNYCGEWINALENETLGITKKGIVPASTTMSFVDTWMLTDSGEYIDMTIPMVRGENVISFNKLASDIWFDNLLFTKVDNYTALSYTAAQMHENATAMSYDKYGVQYENCFTMRGANSHYVTLKFEGTSGKYNIGVKGATQAEGAEFDIINETSEKSVSSSLNTGALNTTDWATAEGLDINTGDLITIKYTKGVMFLTNINFTEVGDVEIESEVGYAATDAEYTNALTVDGALSMPEGAFAEFNINAQDCLYLAAMGLYAEEDSLIKLTAGTESVYKFIRAGSEEGSLLINMPEGAGKAVITVEKGAISLSEIGLYYDTDTTTYSEALSAFAEAKTADAAKDALSLISQIDAPSDFEGIFYSDSVVNSLKQNVYTDITALLSDYAKVVYNERTNPSIVLKNKDGEAVNTLEAGAMTLSAKADWLEDTMSIYLAVYNSDGKLISIDTKEYVDNGISLGITVPETGSYTYRIFVWDDMTPYSLSDSTSEINKVYVSVKNGNDNNDGSLNAPVATVEKAKEIVNNMKYSLDSDIYVLMEAGDYYIDSPVVFTEADSGFSDNKIIYQGNTNGTTVINGGKEVTDYVIVNQILTATVDAEDVRQLYVNGKPATMSVGDEITATELYSADGKEGIVVATETLPEGFENETSAELVYVNNWIKSRFPVKELIALEDNKTALVLGEAFSYQKDTTKAKFISEDTTLYFENCVCFTDEAGEFTFDREAKTITYYKNSGETVNSIFVPVSEGLINICGTESEKVKNIAFENITFENGAWNYPSDNGLAMGQADCYSTAAGQESYKGECALVAGQISLNNCENIEFKNNTVKNIGSVAFALNEGVENCVISGNDISNTAAGGVRVGNTKHYTDAYLEKRCSENVVSNNTIEDISLQYSTSPAITVFYTNATQITHNTIKNTPYSAISLGWGWGTWDAKYCTDNEISYNRIENVMMENGLSTLKDGAHIYTNGQQSGTKIFNNYMIKSSDPTSGRIGNYGGIYLDNGSSNITAYNNVVEECYRWLCVPDETVGENGAISFYDNYSDTTTYSADSPYITVEAAGSNTSDAAIEIKNNAGAF